MRPGRRVGLFMALCLGDEVVQPVKNHRDGSCGSFF
jgi:hypothetical protein